MDTSTSITMLPMFFGQPGKSPKTWSMEKWEKRVNRSLEKN